MKRVEPTSWSGVRRFFDGDPGEHVGGGEGGGGPGAEVFGGADDAEHVAPDAWVEGYGFEGGEVGEG